MAQSVAKRQESGFRENPGAEEIVDFRRVYRVGYYLWERLVRLFDGARSLKG